MPDPTLLYLCDPAEPAREQLGYERAFQKMGIQVLRVGSTGSIQERLRSLPPIELIGIIHPDLSPGVPSDLWTFSVPNLCFQIDTNSVTARRIRISKLFDAALVFHPDYDRIFEEGGVKQVMLVPHAVEKHLFDRAEIPRIFDIGWVGNTQAPNFSMRRKILPLLQAKYTLNDPFQHYTPEAMAEVYCSSKIVVNIPKDDYLQDANLRCFESMAAGALLFTFLPTELTAFGFRDGEHFIGFSSIPELLEKIDYFLSQDTEREQIARRARELALQEHTYDQRALMVLDRLKSLRLVAPARTWTPEQRMQELIYWVARSGKIDESFHLLRQLPRGGKRLIPYLHIARTFLSQTRYSLKISINR